VDSCTRSDLIGWRHFAALPRWTIHAVTEGQLAQPARTGAPSCRAGLPRLAPPQGDHELLCRWSESPRSYESRSRPGIHV